MTLPRTLLERVDAYIDAFNRRDLDALAALFDDAVELRDWTLHVQGKDAVVATTSGIVESAALRATAVGLFADAEKATVTAELLIEINGAETIKVVDVIAFTPEGRIKAIRAYKG